jgi:mRNA-degrading endonuclease toxin of MazEF toxin-antitoxin module
VSSSAPRLPGQQGAIYTAVVAYAPEPPFAVLQPDGSERRYQAARDLAVAVREQAEPQELSLHVRAKIRPVLLLQDRPLGRFDEYAALQITSLSNLSPDLQERVRRQEEPSLFHLDPSRKTYGLAKESVTELNSLVRIRRAALVGKRLGGVDEAEFRTICERLIQVSDLDIRNLIVREAGELIRRLRQRPN